MTGRAINGVGLTLVYDAPGRVTSETNVLGTFTSTYDGVTSRLATVAYPNGQTSTYSYFGSTGDHRLRTIHHQKPDTSTLSKFDYTYDAVGNIQTWRQQADTTAVLWTYGYDAADQLTAAVKTDLSATVLQRFAYAYDPAGNRTSEQFDDAVTSATYDSLNRLQTQSAGGPIVFKGSVNEPATVTVQGRPAVVTPGNTFQTTAPLAAGTTTVTVTATDPSGNTTTAAYEVDQAAASKAFTYDSNGNLTSDGTRTFEWNAREQLVAVTVGTHRSEFTYDGLHRRVREVEKESGIIETDTKVVWCETQICEERAADGSTVVRRAFAEGEQISGTSRFFTSDHLGSVTAVTNEANVLLATYAFDPSGRRTVIAGTDVTTVGFTGDRQHVSSQLALTLYRAYDAASATWISADPLVRHALILSTLDFHASSAYAYADGNPIARRDVLGLQAGPAEAATVVAVCSNPVAAAAAAVLGLAVAIVSCDSCRKETTKKLNCDEQYANDSNRCRSFTNKRLKALCWSNAMDRYSDCLAGRPPRPPYPIH